MAQIAIALAEDFEDSEFAVPYQRLRDAGHTVVVFGSDAPKRVKGKRGEVTADVEHSAPALDPNNFDALVIPGGYSPDHLRTDSAVVDFVRRFAARDKLLAAVCHGPQLLIEADVVRGRTLTSWPSVRTDLQNAGATWVDKEVVADDGLITSRKPDDLEAFCSAILKRLET